MIPYPWSFRGALKPMLLQKLKSRTCVTISRLKEENEKLLSALFRKGDSRYRIMWVCINQFLP